MRILLTGATGLLGRNLLFEILKQNIHNLEMLEVILLGRPKDTSQYSERIESVLLNDGVRYLEVGQEMAQKFLATIKSVSCDLLKNDLGISGDDLNMLREKEIDCFFHVAALTDFRDSAEVENQLNETNVNGTKRILGLIEKLDVKEVVYVSSAYCCGKAGGKIEPDYIDLESEFRNPYEKSKLRAEIAFKLFAERKKLKFKIFRPTTICGRLIESPIGGICKFDVFYGWAAFFLRQKLKIVKSFKEVFDLPSEIRIDIYINFRSGLNIVPADYAAKVMYGAFLHNDSHHHYHLANFEEIPHLEYFNLIFDCLLIRGHNFVDKMPQQKSPIEKLYYKSVGKIFTPYITCKPMHFSRETLKDLERKMSLKCPPMNRQNFMRLLRYAKEKYFGVNVKEVYVR